MDNYKSATIIVEKLRAGLQKVGTKLYETEITFGGAGMPIYAKAYLVQRLQALLFVQQVDGSTVVS